MKWDQLRFVGVSNVDLPIIGASASGPFVLKGAEGLDPPPVDVSYAETVEEGGVRQKKRAQNRQIVALIGLQPAWDIGQTSEELRTLLYGLLTPKYDQPTKAQIMLDGVVVAQAQGDVSNIETSIFTKDPEVQVTLDCDHPYLLNPQPVSQLPTRTVSGGQTSVEVSNTGTAPSGFLLKFTLQDTLPGSLQIAEDNVLGRVMNISGQHNAGDIIILDTRPGQRKLNKIQAGTSTQVSILNNLTYGSPWLMLHQGNNKLRINTTLFDWYQEAFTHTPAYWGV